MTELFIALAILATVFVASASRNVIREHLAWRREQAAYARLIQSLSVFSAALTAMGAAATEASVSITRFGDAFAGMEEVPS